MTERMGDAERVLRAYFAAINAGDIEAVLRLYADDVVFSGLGACKGRPCVGKAAVRARFLEPVIASRFQVIELAVSRADPFTVEGRWLARMPPIPDYADVGVELVRGRVSARVVDGVIASLIQAYDLSDPSTVVMRALSGEICFGLYEPGSLSRCVARVLVTDVEPTRTAILVQCADPPPPGLTGRIHRGGCDQPGPPIHQLAAFCGDQSESLVDASLDELRSPGAVIVLAAADGPTIACGKFPQPAAPR